MRGQDGAGRCRWSTDRRLGYDEGGGDREREKNKFNLAERKARGGARWLAGWMRLPFLLGLAGGGRK